MNIIYSSAVPVILTKYVVLHALRYWKIVDHISLQRPGSSKETGHPRGN